jgi:predicted RNase H-related nuclease YkuK (DUF458 family)
MGRGGSIIIHTQKALLFDSLRLKLISEAMRSLETAWYIEPKVPKNQNIIIHLDVNGNLKWESGKYKEELVSMIVSQNFKCVHKPDSWGAMKVSDRKCKR